MTAHRIVDLFAGAGGWEEGLLQLGHRALGIEFDPWAAATARAAGHDRLEADVAALDPRAFGPVEGLIGSPPCQAYSTAGKGLGRADKPRVIACAHELTAGNDSRAEHAAQCRDPRSLLTVEPLRWTLALKPRWVALEQVPAALELWSEFAGLLAVHGYHVAAGVLSAEQYGVPQSRRRAFLIASLDGPVQLPAPTHRSYDPRHPHRVLESEQGLSPWVSMGQALGRREPAVTLTHSNTGHGTRPLGLARTLDCPARTLDSTSGSWTIHPLVADDDPHYDTRQGWGRPRSIDKPAPTISGSCPPIWVTGSAARAEIFPAPGGYRPRRGERVTVEQASVLQGFRRDYPWSGSRARQFRQIGNAVCPPLAREVLAAAMAPSAASGGAR